MQKKNVSSFNHLVEIGFGVRQSALPDERPQRVDQLLDIVAHRGVRISLSRALIGR
jgi:hypothetical protein